MYGTYIRAFLAGVFSPILAAALARFLAPLLKIMEGGEYSDAHGAQMLIGLFDTITNQFLLVEIVSIAVFVFVAAIVERQYGRAVP